MSLESRVERVMEWYKKNPHTPLTPEVEAEIRANLRHKFLSGQKHWLEKRGLVTDD